MRRRFRRGAAFAAAALLLVMAASLVLGKGVLLDGKLRLGDELNIPADETVDGDLYLLGGRARMAGTVNGDLTVLSGQIAIDGNVTGDVLAAGGDVTINGKGDGDVRVAGGQVNVSGSVGQDAAVLGGQVTVHGSGSIGGDLIVAGGQVTMAGKVAGSVEGSAGQYSGTGSVAGTEHVVIQRSQPGPTVGGSTALDALRQFVVVVLAGAMLLWGFPRGVSAAEVVLRKRPLLAIGAGLLACAAFIAYVIVAFIAMILLALLFGLLQLGSLVAIEIISALMSIGFVTFAFVLTVVFVADALVGLALARMAVKMGLSSRWRELARLAAGAAVVVILTTIPVVGGWVKLIVILLGLGALAVAWWESWRAGRKARHEVVTGVLHA